MNCALAVCLAAQMWQPCDYEVKGIVECTALRFGKSSRRVDCVCCCYCPTCSYGHQIYHNLALNVDSRLNLLVEVTQRRSMEIERWYWTSDATATGAGAKRHSMTRTSSLWLSASFNATRSPSQNIFDASLKRLRKLPRAVPSSRRDRTAYSLADTFRARIHRKGICNILTFAEDLFETPRTRRRCSTTDAEIHAYTSLCTLLTSNSVYYSLSIRAGQPKYTPTRISSDSLVAMLHR